MRVLILTNQLEVYAGSEIVAMEVAETFLELGVQTDIYSSYIGKPVETDLIGLQVNFGLVEDCPDPFSYDVIWSQHHILPHLLSLHYSDAKRWPFIVSVSLSPFEPYEMPGAIADASDVIIANSKETCERLTAFGIEPDKIKIFHNAAPNRFAISREHNPTLKNVAIISNHVPEEVLGAANMLSASGVNVDHIGLPSEQKRITPEILLHYDAVISIGKTVQYCVLGETPVFIYDQFGGPGWLTERNLQHTEAYNFSGRCTRSKKTKEEIYQQISAGYADAISSIKKIKQMHGENYILKSYVKELVDTATNRAGEQIVSPKLAKRILREGIVSRQMIQFYRKLMTQAKDMAEQHREQVKDMAEQNREQIKDMAEQNRKQMKDMAERHREQMKDMAEQNRKQTENIEKSLELCAAEKVVLSTQLNQIYNSRGWHYVNRIHSLRKKILPAGSIQYKVSRTLYRSASHIHNFKLSALRLPLKKVKVFAKSKIFPIAKFIYNKAPMPYSLKKRIVSISFRYLAPLFKGQVQYINWNNKQSNSYEFNHINDITAASNSHDVFILAIINWDFRTQRPQHLARCLAQNRRVFYIEVDMTASDFRVRKIEENLYVINFPILHKREVQPYTGDFTNDQVSEWQDLLRHFCELVEITAFKSMIIEHPQWWPLACHLAPDFRIIFDCMDDISGFANTTQRILKLEEDLLENCDQLIVSSQYLYDKYKTFTLPHLIRNGGEFEHFQLLDEKRPLPDFLKITGFSEHTDRIRAGYVGAIAEWFDADLIAKAAQDNPDIEFHLCGSVTASAPGKLAAFDNVFMYGEIPYQDVPAFLERMNVLLIPFQLLPIIQACDPVKFYEYSAMGKPTVTTRLPELKRAEGLAFFAGDAVEFAEQIRIANEKGKSPAFRKSLQDYAARNTWSHRAAQLSGVLDKLPKVSVIILSYGEPKWTKAALESLYQGGGNYPNLETIVVDNGSQDDWLLEIRSAAKRYPNVTVIENGENLGFAKGNNVGIEAATGEYILLLNNDAYVAPGAIYAMVRHLENNPEIGAVGPLTNNIGNEAKISVNYDTMGEMRRVAWNVTNGYRGQYSQLRVLAYFAVMFRKNDLENLFGYLSEDYGRGMFEDDDHCAMIRSKGYICALAEDAFIHHHLSGTFNTVLPKEKRELFEANKRIFESKWGPWQPHRYRQDRPHSKITSKT